MKKFISKSMLLAILTGAWMYGCGGSSTNAPASGDAHATAEKPAAPADAGSPAPEGLAPGTYEIRTGSGENEFVGTLKIAPDPDGEFLYSMYVSLYMDSGFLSGKMERIEGDGNLYRMTFDQDVPECALEAQALGNVVKVTFAVEGMIFCGNGLRVGFTNDYKQISKDVPVLDKEPGS